MTEEELVFHCAPTLAGLKCGSLFGWSHNGREEFSRELAQFAARLEGCGLKLQALRINEERALVYMYRPEALARQLERPGVRDIMERAGYGGEPREWIGELKRRIERDGDFPHEIGLFLGYPPEDVRGFMENAGRGCKCVGMWKVYGDELSARRCFARFKSCTAECCRRYRVEGASLEQLAAGDYE